MELEKVSEATLNASDAKLPLPENPDLDVSEVGTGTLPDGHGVLEDQTVTVNHATLSNTDFPRNSAENDMDISQEAEEPNVDALTPSDSPEGTESSDMNSNTTTAETAEETAKVTPNLFVVGNSIDVAANARVLHAVEQYNKAQEAKVVQLANDVTVNIPTEAKKSTAGSNPPAPSASGNASQMPPKPPNLKEEPNDVSISSTKLGGKLRVAPPRAKGISPMKKKQRHTRHSMSSISATRTHKAVRVNTNTSVSALKSGAVRQGINQEKKSRKISQPRSRMRASIGAFSNIDRKSHLKMQAVPSYMRNTSASSGRVKRSSSTDRRHSIHHTKKSSHQMNTKVVRKKKPALTVPTAPSFTNRGSNSRKKVLLSTEERQLQESARQREQLCRRRKKNAKMWTLASTSDGTLGVPAGTLGQVLKPRTVTEAVSPNFQSHPVKKISMETTEERELRKIAEEREQLALRKKQLQRRRAQAHQQNNHPVRAMAMKKPVTEASSPFLRTKVKNGSKVRGENKRGKRNSLALRSYDRSLPVKASHKLTVPTTPKFALNARSRRNAKTTTDDQESKNGEGTYVPVAEMANKVWNGKNTRFIKEAKGSRPMIPVALMQTGPMQVTEPHTPNLRTSSRIRTNKIESYDEREAREMQEIAKKPFQATEFDEKIKQSNGELGVSRVQRKPLTKPESPKFATDSRVGRRSSIGVLSETEEAAKRYKFKALAVGEGVPEYRVPPVEKKKLTTFKPFNLSTSKRTALHKKNVKQQYPSDQQHKPFKARPAPSLKCTTKPKIQKKELTVPKSPQLLGARKSLMAKKALEKKIKKEREDAEKKRIFKAKAVGEGLPSNENVPYQAPYNPQYEVKPFKLSEDPTGAKARHQRQLEKERLEMEKQRNFVARGVPSSHINPFQPKAEKKPFTEINEFNLRSNIRSEKHKQFDLAAKKRREEAEEKLRLEKEELELKASEAYQEEFERNRVDKVRKSKEDVKRFLSAPVSIPKVSKKRLVVPRSPKLGAARRVLKR